MSETQKTRKTTTTIGISPKCTDQVNLDLKKDQKLLFHQVSPAEKKKRLESEKRALNL